MALAVFMMSGIPKAFVVLGLLVRLEAALRI